MKRSFLLPNRWKIPLLLLLIASVALFIAGDQLNFEFSWLSYKSNGQGINDISNNNLTDELELTGIIGSLLALCFCAERIEDEYVRSIRLSAWQWSVIINYFFLLLVIWSVYGIAFIGMLFYNVLTPVLIYLVIFYTRLHILPRFGKRGAAL